MKKRLVISVLVVCSVFLFSTALFAGGKQEKPTNLEENPVVYEGWLRSWEGVELVLSTHQGPNTDAYKEMCREFEEITGAKVTVLDESWTDLLSKHLASSAAQDGAYDLLTFFYGWFGHYVEGGLLEDLNGWFANDELMDPNYDLEDQIPAVLEAYGRYRSGFFDDPDALWAVPYKFDIYTSQYRADLFKEAGIVDDEGNAKPPATWEELIEDAKILSEKFPDIIPVTIPLAVDDPMVSTYLPILCSYGGEQPVPWYDSNLYPKFQADYGLEAINVLLELLPYMPADALNYDYDKVNTLMAQGKTAYAINWNAYLPVLLDEEKSSIADVVKFDNTPGGPYGRPQGLGGWSIGLSSNSKNKEAAFQLLTYLTSREQAKELAMKGGSLARFSVVNSPEIIEAYPYYPLLVEGAREAVARGSDRSWAEIQRILGVELNKILLGSDPEKTLNDAARKVFEAAEQAGYDPGKSGPKP